jgi:hypothetical protein
MDQGTEETWDQASFGFEFKKTKSATAPPNWWLSAPSQKTEPKAGSDAKAAA